VVVLEAEDLEEADSEVVAAEEVEVVAAEADFKKEGEIYE